jgi:hypothetical protein
MKFIVPVAYLLLAAYVWVDFVQTNPDGLANIGLMIVTLPIAALGLLLGWALGQESFVLLPSGFGYLGDHALYYWPSVLLIALGLYWIGVVFGRRRRLQTTGTKR